MSKISIRINIPVDASVNQDKLTANQEKILKMIDENQAVTVSEMASKIQISERAIKPNIAKLKSKSALSREGADKNGYWKILIND